jgi:hypothetical protein
MCLFEVCVHAGKGCVCVCVFVSMYACMGRPVRTWKKKENKPVNDALCMKVAQTLSHLLADLKLLAHCEPSLLLKESLVQASSVAELEDEACERACSG